MSSHRTEPQPLSDTDIRQIAAEVGGGRPPMVWFTSAAVGVPEGRSGKVIALGDPAEGDFLQVRPTGSKDVLSFSPTEVTLTKPVRRPTSAAGPAPQTPTRKDSTVTMPSLPTIPSSPDHDAEPPAAQDIPSHSVENAAPKPSGKPAAGGATRAPRTQGATTAKKGKVPEVTVTLSGTADGEWVLDVVHGKKRTIKGLSVPSSAVAHAAKILHPEVAEVIDSVLESVRTSQRAKVEQLQSELEAARRLLDELAG